MFGDPIQPTQVESFTQAPLEVLYYSFIPTFFN